MDDKMDYMGPLKHILLATDASEYSEGAVKEAIYLAKSCVAKFSVIYVLETNPEFETEGLKFVEKMEVAAREHLEAIRKMAAEQNVECETLVRRTDQPHKAIIEAAEKMSADVIVMGRHGKSGLEKVLIGSVTAKVIGYSPCNVLVVPRDAQISCKSILVATDGSKYSEMAATKAIDIAKRCKSNLTALSVAPSELLANVDADTGYTQQQLDILAKEIFDMSEKSVKSVEIAALKEGLQVERIVMGGRPYEGVVETAKKKKSDLVVIGSHGRTGFKKFLMGSVAERVVGLAPCAVLVVKA